MSDKRKQMMCFSSACSAYFHAVNMATATGLFTKPGAWRWEAPAFLGMTVAEHMEMLNETLADPAGDRAAKVLSAADSLTNPSAHKRLSWAAFRANPEQIQSDNPPPWPWGWD